MGHWDEIVDYRRENRAYCMSKECAAKPGREFKGFENYRVLKNVSFSTNKCPDCKNYLKWETELIRVDKKSKKGL